MRLISLGCAWLAGIYLGSRFNLPVISFLFAFLPLFLLLFKRFRRTIPLLATVLLLVLFGGAFRYQATQPPVSDAYIGFYNGSQAEVRGIVCTAPESSEKSIHVTVAVSGIKGESGWLKVDGRVMVFAPQFSSYQYGDELVLTGKLERPGQVDDFDYGSYLQSMGITSTMSFPDIQVTNVKQGNPLIAGIVYARNALSRALSRVLPEPQASLAQGFILGIRQNIPPDLKVDFNVTGTTHLLAISGMNLTVLTGLLISLGLWLFGKRHYIYIWLSLVMVWLYAMLVGFGPPIVRSAVMASLFLLAEAFGRQKSAGVSLVFAAAIMVGIDPRVLWDASFQLSFLAMLGLVLLAPPIQNAAVGLIERNHLPWVPVSLTTAAVNGLAVSFAAVLMVWPVIGYYFGVVSFISPVTTFLALPALSGIIITGFAAAIGGILFLPLGIAAGWFAWCFLSYLLVVVHLFAGLPFISASSGHGGLLIWIYYPVLALSVWVVRAGPSKIKSMLNWFRSKFNRFSEFVFPGAVWLVPALVLLAVIPWSITAILPDDNLHVTFLDVGQGDAILIEQGTQQVLVDGGPSSQVLSQRLGHYMPFWDRTIDMVIMTHPDLDHANGLLDVPEKFTVARSLSPDMPSSSITGNKWDRLMSEKKVDAVIAQPGQVISVGGTRISVLGTSPEKGIVLKVVRGDVSFLLTADISLKEEYELLEQSAVAPVTVLKVAHHGSSESSSSEFLNVTKPQAAVISVGSDNEYGHPGQATLDRLEAVVGENHIYRTDERGTIEFSTDGEKLWVRTDR